MFWVYYSIAKADDRLNLPEWKIGSEMLSLLRHMQNDDVVSKSLSLTIVRLACDCTRRFKSHQTACDEEIRFLTSAMKVYPDEVFVLRALAWAYRGAGQKDKALSLFRRILKVKNDAYLWSEVYDFVDDGSVKLSVLCKALLLQPKPEYTGKIRLNLAKELVGLRDYGRALYELNIYHDTYSRNAWTIAPEYSRIVGTIPAGTSPKKTGREFYSGYAEVTNEYIFQDVPPAQYIPVCLSERQSDGSARLVLADRKGRGLLASLAAAGVSSQDYARFSYFVRSSRSQTGGRRIISCKKSDDIPSWRNNISCFTGNITLKTDRDGSQYGIIGQCFIPPQLVARLKPGQSKISVVGVRKDGKWKATFLLH